MFINDLADQFFETVFKRYDARKGTIFIGDDGEVVLGVLHLAHQFRHRLCLGHDVCWAHDASNEFVSPASALKFHQILGVHRASNVVNVVIVDP